MSPGSFDFLRNNVNFESEHVYSLATLIFWRNKPLIALSRGFSLLFTDRQAARAISIITLHENDDDDDGLPYIYIIYTLYSREGRISSIPFILSVRAYCIRIKIVSDAKLAYFKSQSEIDRLATHRRLSSARTLFYDPRCAYTYNIYCTPCSRPCAIRLIVMHLYTSTAVSMRWRSRRTFLRLCRPRTLIGCGKERIVLNVRRFDRVFNRSKVFFFHCNYSTRGSKHRWIISLFIQRIIIQNYINRDEIFVTKL